MDHHHHHTISDHWFHEGIAIHDNIELDGALLMESSSSPSPSPSSSSSPNSTPPITTTSITRVVDMVGVGRAPGLSTHERRLRPPHDLSLKCPRCDSANTKFCYYNNYSLTQPRYFCKTCRRYWTKGGTLRNIPVGGGCRKNNKANNNNNNNLSPSVPLSPPPPPQGRRPSSDLHLSSSSMHLSHHGNHPSFMGGGTGRYNNNNIGMMVGINPPTPFDFMDTKYHESSTLLEQLGTTTATASRISSSTHYSRSYDFMGNASTHHHMGFIGPNFHALCPPPFDENNINNVLVEVKPNPKILALGWQDQPCFDDVVGKDSAAYGYINGIGMQGSSWPGFINGSNSSNSMV